MYPGLLDMFHDAGDDAGFSVRNGIDIDLDRVLQKFVDEDRMAGRSFDGRWTKSCTGLVIIRDLHGSSPQDIGGPDDDG